MQVLQVAIGSDALDAFGHIDPSQDACLADGLRGHDRIIVPFGLIRQRDRNDQRAERAVGIRRSLRHQVHPLFQIRKGCLSLRVCPLSDRLHSVVFQDLQQCLRRRDIGLARGDIIQVHPRCLQTFLQFKPEVAVAGIQRPYFIEQDFDIFPVRAVFRELHGEAPHRPFLVRLARGSPVRAHIQRSGH